MKLTRSILATALTLSLSIFSFLSIAATHASGQDSRIALQRGYRTGYSDGYMAGYRDSIDKLGREMSRHRSFPMRTEHLARITVRPSIIVTGIGRVSHRVIRRVLKNDRSIPRFRPRWIVRVLPKSTRQPLQKRPRLRLSWTPRNNLRPRVLRSQRMR